LRKAYSAANSILSKTKYVSEIVRLNVIESYVFPILFYALEAVTLPLSQQRQFAICLNNLSRRRSIFGMHKWESVKPVQYFCGKLDFVNEYNLRRLRFISGIRAMHNDALLDCVNNLVSYSQYYVNTASLYNLTSGDNTRSLRKIVFCEFTSIAMSRL